MGLLCGEKDHRVIQKLNVYIYIYITYKIINNLQIHKQTNKFIYNYLKKNTDQSESSISKYHDQI